MNRMYAADSGELLHVRTAELLRKGDQPVRIVCFGDSVTGVYYHTGGRRAYSDMLEIGLRRLYPQCTLQVFNAGISGNTADQGLERIEHDVFSHAPHLVTVMFGMNDVARQPIDVYRSNLEQIVTRCRSRDAEVILCTPNSIYPEDEARPVLELERFAETVKDVAREMAIPFADCWRAYEDKRNQDERSWQLLMSETIHPSMHGHKVIAEEIVKTITGEAADLADEPRPLPAIPVTITGAHADETIRVIAMPPYDGIIPDALKCVLPGVRVQVTKWPTEGKSLEQIEHDSRYVVGRERLAAHSECDPPHLVVLAIPAEAQALGEASGVALTEEQFIRSYSLILNWSQSFAVAEWDCIAVLPSVANAGLSGVGPAGESLAREIIRGQDIGMVERITGDTSSATALLTEWLQRHVECGM